MCNVKEQVVGELGAQHQLLEQSMTPKPQRLVGTVTMTSQGSVKGFESGGVPDVREGSIESQLTGRPESCVLSGKTPGEDSCSVFST